MNIPTSTQFASVFSGASGHEALRHEAPRELTQPAAGERVKEPSELRNAFDDFVGQTFFQQMLSAMRKTVDKPAYFHGGRAEEVFQGQLDQVLSEHMTKAAASEFTDPLFELYSLKRT